MSTLARVCARIYALTLPVRWFVGAVSAQEWGIRSHLFTPASGHPDDDECTHRADGTDATYCGEPEHKHEWSLR